MRGEATDEKCYNKLFDLDKVELQIKNQTSSTWKRIIGDQMEAIISEGGRLGDPVINHKTPINKSNWLSNGINLNAYNNAETGNNARNPWDEYYFIDFTFRIHKDDPLTPSKSSFIADFPSDARYNDGKYNFRVKATRANNTSDYITSSTLLLDNFQPYLTKIEVKSNNSDLYEISRNRIDADLKVANNGTVSNFIGDYSVKTNPIFTYPLTVEIRTSEPM